MRSSRPLQHSPPSTTTPSSSSASASNSSRLTTPFTASQREYSHHHEHPRRRSSHHRSAEKTSMLTAHAPTPTLPLLRPYTEVMPAPSGLMPRGFIDNEHAPRHVPGPYTQYPDLPRGPILQHNFASHSPYIPLLAQPSARPLPQLAPDHPQLPHQPPPQHPPLPPQTAYPQLPTHSAVPALAMPRRMSRPTALDRAAGVIAAPAASNRRTAPSGPPHMPMDGPSHNDIMPSSSSRRRTSHGQSQSGYAQQNQHAVESPPSILTREKKQKACAGCRRAKLKCITEEGQNECIRCRARNEKCYFYPRNHVSRRW